MHTCIRVNIFAQVNGIVISMPFSNWPVSLTHVLWTLLTSTEDSRCVDAALSDSWFTFNSTLPISQVTVTRLTAVRIRGGDLRMEPCPMQLS